MRTFWLMWLIALMLVLDGCVTNEVRTTNNLPVYCLDEPDPGPCGEHLLGYYYDYRNDSCRSFHYGGCQGHVPFETMDACEESCVEGTIAREPIDNERPKQDAEAKPFAPSTLAADAEGSVDKEQPRQDTEAKPFPPFTLAADVLDRLFRKKTESE